MPSKQSFGIRHYAGLVIYDASEFLEKNRDTIPLDLLEVFNTSVFDVIKELFDTKDAKRPYESQGAKIRALSAFAHQPASGACARAQAQGRDEHEQTQDLDGREHFQGPSTWPRPPSSRQFAQGH